MEKLKFYLYLNYNDKDDKFNFNLNKKLIEENITEGKNFFIENDFFIDIDDLHYLKK